MSITTANTDRFINHAITEGFAENKSELFDRLALIPAHSREIIESRWGLDGQDYCSDFAQFAAKLGTPDAHRLYFMAMRDLSNAEYAELAIKHYNLQAIPNWNDVVAMGILLENSLKASHKQELSHTAVIAIPENKTYIHTLPLSVRARNCLTRAGYETFEEYLRDPHKLNTRARSFGPRTATEIATTIKSMGLAETAGKNAYDFLVKSFKLII